MLISVPPLSCMPALNICKGNPTVHKKSEYTTLLLLSWWGVCIPPPSPSSLLPPSTWWGMCSPPPSLFLSHSHPPAPVDFKLQQRQWPKEPGPVRRSKLSLYLSSLVSLWLSQVQTLKSPFPFLWLLHCLLYYDVCCVPPPPPRI